MSTHFRPRRDHHPQSHSNHPPSTKPATDYTHILTSRCGGYRTPIANVALLWHDRGMPRIRVSTTVDEGLLEEARGLRSDVNDATLLDQALAALLAQHKVAEIDAAYQAYDDRPLDQPDEWGDLASFRRAAGSS